MGFALIVILPRRNISDVQHIYRKSSRPSALDMCELNRTHVALEFFEKNALFVSRFSPNAIQALRSFSYARVKDEKDRPTMKFECVLSVQNLFERSS
jgi:hypothetical protein